MSEGLRHVVEEIEAARLLAAGLDERIVRHLNCALASLQGITGAVCCECGQPFTASRKPNPNRRAFCPECRADGAPLRWAARDSRARKRQGAKQ